MCTHTVLRGACAKFSVAVGVASTSIAGVASGSIGPALSAIGVIPGDTTSVGSAISADGTTVVGLSQGATTVGGFRWSTASGLIPLAAAPGDGYSEARGVNGDGSTVVGTSWFDSSAKRSLTWGSGSPGSPGVLALPAGWTGNNVNAISSDGGAIVGTAINSGVAHAVRWTSSGFQDLGGLVSGRDSAGLAASSNGAVVVGWAKASDGWSRATRWTASGPASLGLVGSNRDSYAMAVSGDGSVVAGFSGTDAFRWSALSGLVPLTVPSGFSGAQAFGISADGLTIVGSMNGNLAMIWTEGAGMQNLNTYLASLGVNLSGWTLTQANGVSADSRSFTGVGVHQYAPGQFRYEAWYATVVPAPGASVALGICGLAGGVGVRRRKSLRR